MKIETPATYKPGRPFAFTLIELLVVIAIIAILAALFLSLGSSTSVKKKLARVKVELTQITTMIDSYHEKLGYLPPDNPNNPALNTLFYELSGSTFTGGSYTPLDGSPAISSNNLYAVFGMRGLANSSSDSSEVRSFSKGLRSSQVAWFTNHPAFPTKANMLSVPVTGAQPGVNTWRYVSTSPTNNPNGYDLWAEIVIGGKTYLIGNWKN